MHPAVDSLPKPAPDYRRFLQVLRREVPDAIPLIELAVHPDVVTALLDEPAPPTPDACTNTRRNVRLLHRLGYDVVKVSAPIPFTVPRITGDDASDLSSGQRTWVDQHQGTIGSLDDVEKYPWPTANTIDFAPLDAARQTLPDGMRVIGFAGGVLEFSMDLIGMEQFMYATYDKPDMIAAVIDRVGHIILSVFESYCQMEHVCALWLGDDLGSRNGLLVSPALLEKHVFPWYRKFAELAHTHNRPFLLHSCGKTESLMPTLINQVGIDAKHSFEDNIQPVEQFLDAWGDRIAVLGGVDVNLLAVGETDAITDRVTRILEEAAPRGGYAAGSGNSIPNYVPPENYLTLIQTVARFNA
jgi:uroporphyrinogen decarboxylase